MSNAPDPLERIASSLEQIASHLGQLVNQKAVAHRDPNTAGSPRPPSATGDGHPETRSPQAVPSDPSASSGTASAQPSAAEPSSAIDNASSSSTRATLRAFLEERGIEIKTSRQSEDADDVLDHLAHFMGSHYDHIEAVYKQVKRAVNGGRGFNLNLSHASQDEVSASTQFCTRLHRLAFLTDYVYLNSPRYQIHAKAAHDPRAIQFLTGGWLERYVRQTVRTCLSDAGEKVALLSNAQIVLPNGDDFELDLVAQYGERVLWLEAKTGNYQRHVGKYRKMGGRMQVAARDTLMVLAGVPPHTAERLSKVHAIGVTPVQDLSDALHAWKAA